MSQRSYGQTDGQGQFDAAIDPVYKYIYFISSLTSACYIVFNESSIPFYSTINAYKNLGKVWLQ